MRPIPILTPMMLALALSFPAISHGDQTDQRLAPLFETLQSSQDETVLTETEAAIWDLWYDSGRKEIDELMLQAAELVQAGQLAAAEKIYSEVVAALPEFSEGWNRRATVLEPARHGAVLSTRLRGLAGGYRANPAAGAKAFRRHVGARYDSRFATGF
jgi:hypothetical protein